MSEPARRGEMALGILTHYATGIVLTGAFLQMSRREEARPSFVAGTGYGIATAALPLLVLYPSLGYGWLGLRSGEAAGDQPDIIEALGIDWALAQIRDLLAHGAPGYHLYILNRARSALTRAAGLAA